MGDKECVKVVIRCRPLSKQEVLDNRKITVELTHDSLMLHNPGGDRALSKPFTFDRVYDSNSSQMTVFQETAQPIILSVVSGYNGTIFAYGQTGTGKTFTMEGVADNPELRGIIPNSFNFIFDHIRSTLDKEFLVRAQYLEIYNEEVRDLLAKDPKNRLDIKESTEHGVYVKDLTSYVVKSAQEMDNVLQVGKKNRSTGATAMNQDSSRSHSIFTIIVEVSEQGPDNQAHIRVGKLNLVDLAGSERQSKTLATGDRLREATKINLSLSALGNVISALVDAKSAHIPYRDSKLTRLLQDSLGGNTKTVMVANMGPADYNYDETLSTLRYANRAKNIKNKPKINEDPKDAMLREFQEEIQRLKEMLQNGGAAGGMPMDFAVGQSDGVVSDEVVERLKAQLAEQARQEREGLAAERAEAEAERLRIEQELATHQKELEAERQQRETIQSELQAMQEKLLMGCGDENSEAAQAARAAAAEKQQLLDEAHEELQERQRQKDQLEKELAMTEEAQLMAEEKYASVQEEAQAKTKKLKRLWQKYQLSQQEVLDLQEEFQREREDMLETIRELQRQTKFNKKILDNFVPVEEVRKLERRATWDAVEDDWQMSPLEITPSSLKRPQSSRRPQSESGRKAEQPQFDFDGVAFRPVATIPNLYLSYNGGTEEDTKPSKRSSSSVGRRPESASRKKISSKKTLRGSNNFEDHRSDSPGVGKSLAATAKFANFSIEDEDGGPQNFPKARGLVSSGRRFA